MDGLELRFKKIGDGGAWSYITYRCLESFDPDIPTSKSIGSTSVHGVYQIWYLSSKGFLEYWFKKKNFFRDCFTFQVMKRIGTSKSCNQT